MQTIFALQQQMQLIPVIKYQLAFMFPFSKLPELFDTVFIVLRKQKLSFLHVYHHVSIFIYCWYSYAYPISTGIYCLVLSTYAYIIQDSIFLLHHHFSKPCGLCMVVMLYNMFFLCSESLFLYTLVVHYARDSSWTWCHVQCTCTML